METKPGRILLTFESDEGEVTMTIEMKHAVPLPDQVTMTTELLRALCKADSKVESVRLDSSSCTHAPTHLRVRSCFECRACGALSRDSETWEAAP